MFHGRPDYNRIQDPAAEPEVYRLVGRLAEVLAGAEAVAVPGESVAAAAVVKLGSELRRALDDAPGADVLRAFAARAELPAGSRPVGVHEPVFLLRGQDDAAGRAVMVYASMADRRAGAGVATGARIQAARMASWAAANGFKDADLPGGPQNRLSAPDGASLAAAALALDAGEPLPPVEA